ncbi:CRISPR-associated endonuclease Cas2 [Pontibacter burrus]|nr:CRISPR-associated endonuclease Cas2 [Pontibacter burrus]
MQNRLNAYRSMWLFVFFDLPTETKQDKKEYTTFRKRLQKDGFSMMQYSVYTRHCASRESADVHVSRVKQMLPPKGLVTIAQFTDKQYSRIINFWGNGRKAVTPAPKQLEMF